VNEIIQRILRTTLAESEKADIEKILADLKELKEKLHNEDEKRRNAQNELEKRREQMEILRTKCITYIEDLFKKIDNDQENK